MPLQFGAALFPTWLSSAPLTGPSVFAGSVSWVYYRIVSGDAARVLTRILPAEFQIRQRLVEFYLRNLEHGRDLVPGQEAVLLWSLLSPPLSILCLKLCQLTRIGLCPFGMLQRVERQVHWTEDPAIPPWTPPIFFLDRETAVSHIRQA